MELSTITIADFKAQFPADFPYLPVSYIDSIYNYVQDAEITAAFAKTQIVLNQALFSSDASIKVGYLLAAAHYLVMSVRNRMQGIRGAGQQLTISKGAGNVNEAFVIPDRFAKDPVLNFFAKTGYGQEFISLIMPGLIGNVVSVYGGTQP
jgi:hypothetical protein